MSRLFLVLDTGAAILLVALLFVVYRGRQSARGPLPPGPRGWPLVGNVFDMPATNEWNTFMSWGEKWGDVVSVTLFGQHIVILNSIQHAYDMFEKKSNIYSDRPAITMAGEMVGWDRTLVLLRYGTRFRETRKLFSQLIGTRSQTERFSQHLEHEVHRFLRRILREPTSVLKEIRKTTGAVILKMAYGYEVQEGDDPLVDLVDRAVDEFSISTRPGAFLVDTFPILRHVPAWMPGASWKKKAKVWADDLEMTCNVPYAFTQQQMSAGTAIPSFTSTHLESNPVPEKEIVIKNAAFSLYSAGADTTVSAISTFFLAMTCYPEAQRKAQAEIDAVIGNDRLPTLADRDKLPFVTALCCEVLRWQPVAPLGVPHCPVADDFHAGFLIPKGTIVFPNIWKFLHDPDTYANPFDFEPERFIASPGKTAEKDPRQIVFGFGRRICPGMYLADASLFISCAVSLAVFDISKVVRDGKVIEPVIDYTSGTISHPRPFECSIRPRSANAEALITAMHETRER
uniref:Cytochrome P450 n=1 Tax=Rhodonia placenta TaxID=104341 RepID=F1SYH9_9APHY|nr:cytochrome P450 [Postia placenta]